ncbi:MAG: hypothetical protein R6V02_08925 [Candidatus Aminicenantes bacterium]
MTKTALFVSLALMMTLGSCIIAGVEYPGGYSPVEEFHQYIPFEPAGNLALVNFDGNIEITGWDRKEVEIYAERYVEFPSRRQVQFLWENKSVPQVNVEQNEDYLKISTRAPSPDGALVDYFINVPYSIQIEDIIAREGRVFLSGLYGSVRVELAAGDVEVENFSGSLTALVTRGSIEAALYDLRTEDEVILNCREGNVTLFLQEGIHASVYAEAPNGRVLDEFQLKRANDSFMDTRIGEGGAVIRVTVMNGDIHIKQISSNLDDE